MNLPLSKTCKITQVSAGAAAGSNNVTCDGVSMSGYSGVLFLANFGTITANAVTGIKAQGDVESTFGNAVDLVGTLVAVADTADNKCAYVDVFNTSQWAYIRPIINRATANAVVGPVFAIQYGGRWTPTTHDATTVVAGETHVDPANGTA